MTHLCFKFCEFMSSSIVMALDLKTRPRTDRRGDDSARAVVNRQSFNELFMLLFSRKGTLALFPDNFGSICRSSTMLQ